VKDYLLKNRYAARYGERFSTYAGYPEGLAIAAANLKYIKKHKLIDRVRTLEPLFKHCLSQINSVSVAAVRNMGLAGAIEFYDPEMCRKVYLTSRKNGLELIYGHNILRVAPALTISEKLLKKGFDILTDSILESEV
jgi:acetylornithine/succinyldiaminopimelate/putrescine aminotransferase